MNAARRASERERASQVIGKLGLAEKIKNRASLLAEFSFLPCPIRVANSRRALDFTPRSPCPLWLNKLLVGRIIKLVRSSSF
jgi:hypothetical protein